MLVQADALERAVREHRAAYDREHVTPYVYHHPELFHTVRVPAPVAYRLPNARVTLDTAEDYAALCDLFDNLYDDTPIPVLNLLRWLQRRAEHAIEITGEVNDYSSGA